jgi:hypothetical protein
LYPKDIFQRHSIDAALDFSAEVGIVGFLLLDDGTPPI